MDGRTRNLSATKCRVASISRSKRRVKPYLRVWPQMMACSRTSSPSSHRHQHAPHHGLSHGIYSSKIEDDIGLQTTDDWHATPLGSPACAATYGPSSCSCPSLRATGSPKTFAAHMVAVAAVPTPPTMALLNVAEGYREQSYHRSRAFATSRRARKPSSRESVPKTSAWPSGCSSHLLCVLRLHSKPNSHRHSP